MPIYSWDVDKAAIVARVRTPAILKLCAKVRDEPLLIEGWITHHQAIVGADNLIIADNMSKNPEMLAVLEKYSDRVTVFRFPGSHNNIHWHPQFAELFVALRLSCRYFAHIDVDERLIHTNGSKWVADASIADQMLKRPFAGIVPTTWLCNALRSYGAFFVAGPDGKAVMGNNLRWGKPILPARLVGYHDGIHNIQHTKVNFSELFSTEIMLLHLTQFPERRLLTNRNKLESRGIIPSTSSIEDVLNMDFANRSDKTFMPLVEEMRRMSQILSSPESTFHMKGETVTFMSDGALSFSSLDAEQVFKAYVASGASTIRSTFQGRDAPEDSFGDPAFMLLLAFKLRDTGRRQQAKLVFGTGMKLHPEYPAEYGGPAFQKELLRMLLAERDWAVADNVAPASDSAETWHQILYARAWAQAGDLQKAGDWWAKVLKVEPANGEAVKALSELGRLRPISPPPQSWRGAFLDDFRILDATLDRSLALIHGFMRQFLALRGLDPKDATSALRTMIQSARVVVEETNPSPTPLRRIPRLVHRIWLTNPDAPREPPERYINNMLKEAEEYRRSGWVHRLWVLDPDRIPQTTAMLIQHDNVVKIESISAQLPNGQWRAPFERLLRDRKFPFAADILRMKILYEMGGLYADMGARFTRRDAAEFILDNFDYALVFWETMFFQNSLMAMPKGSAVGQAFLRLVDHPDTIPRQLLGPLTGATEGMTFSGLMITAILLSQLDKSARVCPLAPNANLVAWASEKSWYTNIGDNMGKYGNAYVPATGPSFLSADVLGTSQPDRLFVPAEPQT